MLISTATGNGRRDMAATRGLAHEFLSRERPHLHGEAVDRYLLADGSPSAFGKLLQVEDALALRRDDGLRTFPIMDPVLLGC